MPLTNQEAKKLRELMQYNDAAQLEACWAGSLDPITAELTRRDARVAQKELDLYIDSLVKE